MKSPGFLFDHCTFSAARCAIVKCISWKLKQVQNKLIPPWDQHSAAGTSPPCAWVTAHLICHLSSVISCPGPHLWSRPIQTPDTGTQLLRYHQHRLDNAASKLLTSHNMSNLSANYAASQSTKRCLISLGMMMKGHRELKYQMFHQIWFLSFDFCDY